MAENKQRDALRSILLVGWGLATLVLVFVVVLLVYRINQAGVSPFDAGTVTVNGGEVSEGTAESRSREIQLYFAAPDRFMLVPERRRIEHTESTVNNCRQALEAIIAGPGTNLVPIVPPDTRIRGMYFLGVGQLVIDLSREAELRHIRSASAERLFSQGLAICLTQLALRGEDGRKVTEIRLLFEGSPIQEIGTTHVHLSGMIEPDRSLLRLRREGPGDV